MSALRLLVRIAIALGRTGLLSVRIPTAFRIAFAWRRCGSSFAFLAEVAALRFPDHLALTDDEGSLTFAQLLTEAQAWARFLRDRHNLGKEAQVAIVCANHRGFVLSLLAATRLGADVLPLGPDLPGSVLSKILERQKISLVLHDRELSERLAGCAPIMPAQAISDILPQYLGSLSAVGEPGQLITLTSGSTGIAKGIGRRPTLGQVLPAMAGLLEALPFQLNRPFLLAIPLYHGYGVATLAVSLALGSPLHLARRYEIAALVCRLTDGDKGILVTVPTLLLRWLRGEVAGASEKLAAILSGSAPLNPDLSTRVIEELGPILFNLYGSSEAGLISLANPTALMAEPGTVGRPLPGNRLRLLDSDGAETRFGEVGRIFVGGPLVLGADAQGWRETGDLGKLDSGGNLHVCGRSDSMMVCGGENVFPHEVEQVLSTHSALDEVAILVVDDEEFGRRMLAAVVLKGSLELEPSELKEWLRERLERHKVPKEIVIVPSIPRNPLGKVDRVALRKILGNLS